MEDQVSSNVIVAPLHLPLTMTLESREGPKFPPPSEELTLRAVQLQQACWDAGRPHRRTAAVEQGIFENDFERADSAQTASATAIRTPASAWWVNVAVRAGGDVYGLVRHTYSHLLAEPLAVSCMPHIPGAEEKYTALSLTQTSLRVRKFNRPYETAVHVTQRESSYLQSPFTEESIKQRADAALMPANPIPTNNAILQSPLKKRMAEVQQASRDQDATDAKGQGSTPPPSARGDPFAFAAAVDPKRSWDAIKTPCGFRAISCSATNASQWALSEQGTPYAYVLVPMSSPPVWDWVRVNSGHVDPESVAGKVTKKFPVRSLHTIACGNWNCVWGISDDSLDYGRCVARVGFTEDNPNGTDWVNMSEGMLPSPLSATEKALKSMPGGGSSALRASRQLTPPTTSVTVRGEEERRQARCFRHVSVGMDGSVWAIVLDVVVPAPTDISPSTAATIAEPLTLQQFQSATIVRSSVWVREGASCAGLGHRWTPLSRQQESFDFMRPYDKALHPQTAHFLELHHVSCNRVLALIAETNNEHDANVGHIYERCGVSEHNITGDCWRKILLDPSPHAVALTLPAQLSLLPAAPTNDAVTRIKTFDIASDNTCFAIDEHKQLFDATHCIARASIHPTATIIHDRFPDLPNYRDSTVDGDLCNHNRFDLTPLIQGHDGTRIRLQEDDRRSILSVASLLDVSSIRILFPAGIPSAQHALFLVSVGAAPSGATFTLTFHWEVAPGTSPLELSIQTTQHVVFDPLLLRDKTVQVAETVRWVWWPAAPMPNSILSTASCGGLHSGSSHDLIQTLTGTCFVDQLDAATSTLMPPLSSWLQCSPTDVLVASSVQGGVDYIESLVHRDLCRDESMFDVLGLMDHSLRQFRQIQTRRLVARTRMMLCGAVKRVTVVSQSPLGTPTPSVVLLCNDFPWVGHAGSSRGHAPAAPLSSLVSRVAAGSHLQRPDNKLFDASLQGWGRTPYKAAPLGQACAPVQFGTSRLFADVLDLLQESCESLGMSLSHLALSNEATAYHPDELLIPKQQESETVWTGTKVVERVVQIQPGMSIICATDSNSLLTWLRREVQSVSPAPPEAINMFDSIVRSLFCQQSGEQNLLLTANITNVLKTLSAQPAQHAHRHFVLQTGTLASFDLIGGIVARYDAKNPNNNTTTTSVGGEVPLRQLLAMQLLSPTLQLVLSNPTSLHATDAYQKQNVCGPFAPGGGQRVVRLERAVVQCTLRFQTHALLGNVVVDDLTRRWITTCLPPSFVATGEITLFDQNSRACCTPSSTLSFVGTTSIGNWVSPGGLQGTTMAKPTVEAVLQWRQDEQEVMNCLELRELRFVGEAAAHGNLAEFAVLQYPILEGRCPYHFSQVFGPATMQVQRKIAPFSELIRGALCAADESPPPDDVSAATPAVTFTRRALFLDGALDRLGCRFINATYHVVGPSTIDVAARINDSNATQPLLVRQPASFELGPLLPHNSDDASASSFILSGQRITISQHGRHNDHEQLHRNYLSWDVQAVTSEPSSEVVGLSSRGDPNTSIQWVFVKCSDSTMGRVTHRTTLLDPVIHYGDDVILVEPTTLMCVNNGGDALQQQQRWRIQQQHPQKEPRGDDRTPLRAGLPFVLVSVAPGGVAVDGGNSSPYILTVSNNHVWEASFALGTTPLFMDLTPCFVLNESAVASVVTAPSNTASVPLLAIAGRFPQPVIPGGRPQGQAAVLTLVDSNDHTRGCGFEVLATERRIAHAAEGGITQHEQDVDFHLTDASVLFLGAAMRCLGSALTEGVAGVSLGDVALHVVGEHIVKPSLEQEDVASSDAEVSDATSLLCQTHKAGIHVHFALDVPLIRSSLLLPTHPSTIGVAHPPCDGGAEHAFHGDLSLSSPTMLLDVRCRGCVASIENHVRLCIQGKAKNVAKQRYDVERIEEDIVTLERRIQSIEDLVDQRLEVHENELAPDEAAAEAELQDCFVELKRVMKEEAQLESKSASKPHKRSLYEFQTLALQERRRELETAIRMARGVHLHHQKLVCIDVSQVAALNRDLSVLRRQLMESVILRNAALRLAALRESSADIDTLAAWSLRSVRFHGSRNATTDAGGAATASVEMEFEVSARSSGRLCPETTYQPAMSALTLLNPPSHVANLGDDDVSDSAAPVPHYHNSASQTSDVVTCIIPFDVTTDCKADSVSPLVSMEAFGRLVVDPVAARWIQDVLQGPLQKHYGLTTEDVFLVAAARTPYNSC